MPKSYFVLYKLNIINLKVKKINKLKKIQKK